MTARGRVDRQTAKVAAVNVALLTMILRPSEPMPEREFEALVIALGVVLTHAERRAGGRCD